MSNEGLRTQRHRGLSGLWSGPNVWAVADQSLLSIGNFVVTFVLARQLPAHEFGVFAVVLGVLILATTTHTSLIGIPLLVRGGGEREDVRELAVAGLFLAALVSTVFSVVLAATVLVLDRPSLFIPAVCALFAWQTQETLRRSLMAQRAFGRAAGGDALSYLGQATLIVGLTVYGRPTVARAFMIIALTSLAASLLQFWQVRPRIRSAGPLRDAVIGLCRLGKWLVLTNFIGGAAELAPIWLLAAIHGAPRAGAFQALITVVGVANPVLLAMNSLVTTGASWVREGDLERRSAHELEQGKRFGALGAILIMPYVLVVLAVPGFVLGLFFGRNSVYVDQAGPLRIFVLGYLLLYTWFVLAGVLNARQDKRAVLAAQGSAAGVIALIGAPLIAMFSVAGASVAASAASGARAGIALRCTLRGAPQPAEETT